MSSRKKGKKVWVGWIFWNNSARDVFYFQRPRNLLVLGCGISEKKIVKNGQKKIRITVEEL